MTCCSSSSAGPAHQFASALLPQLSISRTLALFCSDTASFAAARAASKDIRASCAACAIRMSRSRNRLLTPLELLRVDVFDLLHPAQDELAESQHLTVNLSSQLITQECRFRRNLLHLLGCQQDCLIHIREADLD